MPILALVLGLGAAALLWRLEGGRGSGSRSDPAPLAPSTPAPPPAVLAEPEPAERQELAPAASLPELRPAKLGRLSVLVLWAGLADGDGAAALEPDSVASVRLRHASGAFDTLLEVTPEHPRAEIPCPAGEIELTLERHTPRALGALPVRAVLESETSQLVTLALVPLAVVAGTLVDARGAPLVDVPLWLERRGRPAAETRTEAEGRFAFPPLAEGTYELGVGDVVGPLVPRRTLDLASLTGALAVVVPELFALELRVLDEHGVPVAGARVEGAGDAGGRVAGETGPSGTLEARFLPAGTYRLQASHASRGRARLDFELSPEGRGPLEIQLRREPAQD